MTVSEHLLPVGLLAAYLVSVWFLWRDTFGPWAALRETSPRPGSPHALAQHERVLFVCTHNSARSQMAEALLRHAAPDRFIVASAGTSPTGLHPRAVEVMAERGLSLLSQRAKSLSDVGTGWDYVITVCDVALERCPEFPAKTSHLHWSVADPSVVTDTGESQLERFRRTRDELSQRIERWLVDRPESS